MYGYFIVQALTFEGIIKPAIKAANRDSPIVRIKTI